MKKLKSPFGYIAKSTILCKWTAFVSGGVFSAMQRDKICGIYKITNPKNKIYIGQSMDIISRFSCYKNKTKSIHNQHKIYNSLIKYGADNHKFEIIHVCDKDQLNDLEIYYIELYQTVNSHNGLNLKSGGNKCVFSDEVKLKMRNAHLGTKQDKERIENNRIAQMKNKSRNRVVLQYDLDGNFIKEWESVAECVRNGYGNHVGSCCLKKYGRNTHKGYLWEYKDLADKLNLINLNNHFN